MFIERTKVLRIERYLAALPPGSSFRAVAISTEKGRARSGFPSDAEVGTAILPAIVGRTTRFNAEGKWNIRRDLPKERRYTYSRSWVRQEWAGRDETREVEEIVDYYRECYLREFVVPPAAEVILLQKDGEVFFSSPVLLNTPTEADQNRHVINLLLELFGACEIVMDDLARITPPTVRRVAWTMLPPGEHPWERIKTHITETLGRRVPSVEKVIMFRQEVILSYEPSKIYRGVAGFGDYLAYRFEEKRLVVLESIHFGNALYILGDDWEYVSKLTKAEIIQHAMARHRIVHSKGWVANLAEVFRAKAA